MRSKEVNEIMDKKRKIREDLVLAMFRRIESFKFYVTDTERYYKHPEREYIRDEHYGCKDDIKYYFLLPNTVQFIYQNNHGHSDLLFFNDKLQCWFVIDKEKKEKVTFTALDTDAQIAILDMIDHFLNWENWGYI